MQSFTRRKETRRIRLLPWGGLLRAEAAAAAVPVRRVPIHRRVCTMRLDRIEVRPSRSAALAPLTGVALSVGLFTVIGFYINSLPFGLLAFLLLVGILLLPFSGMGLVYSIAGANVIFDRRKQSATWQQGILGLGIGTQEMVPFWKIAEVVVQEAGHDEEAEGLLPLEEFAQWEVVLVKASGKRLVVGGLTVPRRQAEAGQALLLQVAEAIAQMTGRPLRLEAPEAVVENQDEGEEEDWVEEYDDDEEYDGEEEEP
ncbi:MAG: hypothetical protein ACE5IZ_02810 [Dehalococcoidia bacterium]